MARSRSSGRSSVRHSARSAPAPKQTRSSSTASVPARTVAPPPLATAHAHPPATQGQSPGLFGQMASTAAGVAVGSTVGNMLGAGISGLFGGSSAPEGPTESAAESSNSTSSNSWATPSCEADAKSFTKCLDENQGNMQICSWYLEQLKACQEMAKNY